MIEMTLEMAEKAVKVLPSTGGVPIFVQGRLIGAIGCGGGIGEQDHQCAMAGAQTIAG